VGIEGDRRSSSGTDRGNYQRIGGVVSDIGLLERGSVALVSGGRKSGSGRWIVEEIMFACCAWVGRCYDGIGRAISEVSARIAGVPTSRLCGGFRNLGE